MFRDVSNLTVNQIAEIGTYNLVYQKVSTGFIFFNSLIKKPNKKQKHQATNANSKKKPTKIQNHNKNVLLGAILMHWSRNSISTIFYGWLYCGL
jgi:hypothetical protein